MDDRRLLSLQGMQLGIRAGLCMVFGMISFANAGPGQIEDTQKRNETVSPQQIDQIRRSVRRIMTENDLRSVMLRISVGGRPVYIQSWGKSGDGERAHTRMRFRNGAMAIPIMATVLLRLAEEGVVDLDDPVGKWMPGLPNANSVTLRTLINCTSGYADYVPMEAFIDAFYADPFRAFSARELINFALSESPRFDPGTDWNYSHANFVILGRALERATGRRLSGMIRQYVTRPLGLRATVSNNGQKIPHPVLRAFTSERGTYEESTFWNPSWTLARGAIMTSTLRDSDRLARAMGTGTLLTRASFQEMTAPTTAKFSRFSKRVFFGMGIVAYHGWFMQTPQFGGYAGIMAYRADGDISLAIISTKGPESDVDENFSNTIFEQLRKIL